MRDKIFNFLRYQIEFSKKEIRATIWLSIFALIIGIVPHCYKMMLISNSKPLNINPKELLLIPQEEQVQNTSQVFYNSHEKSTFQFKKLHKEVIKIDINHCDTTTLKKLNGIGSLLAARIIKYREALGGFHSLDQLNEVFGLKEPALSTLKGSIANESLMVLHLIKINSDEFKVILKHPYFEYNDVKCIFELRRKKIITSYNELESVLPKLNRKLVEPYLDYSQ